MNPRVAEIMILAGASEAQLRSRHQGVLNPFIEYDAVTVYQTPWETGAIRFTLHAALPLSLLSL
jgi:hypothetical protein